MVSLLSFIRRISAFTFLLDTVLAFNHQSLPAVCRQRTTFHFAKVQGLHHTYHKARRFLVVLRVNDDGWGEEIDDDDDDDDEKNVSSSALSSTFEVDKLQELRALQSKTTSGGRSSKTMQSAANTSEPDLFIPIFSIVALLGLFGSYGYEMARLASRGELYLPW